MHRRITILALVMALVAVPTAALALEGDDAVTTETDRATTDVAPRDAETDRHRDGLDRLKKHALAAIDRQLAVLDGLLNAIEKSRHITPGHAGQLRGDIHNAQAGLKNLARKIEGATTFEELRPLIEQIGSFQVGHVVAPKTHQVIVSDTMVAGAEKLAGFAEKLAEVIARFEEAGFDVDEAWRLLEMMEENIAAGERLADPVAENVIGLQPEDWPDPAQGILAQGRADLREAGKSLREAHGNGKVIVQFLRNLHDGTDVARDAASDKATTDAAG